MQHFVRYFDTYLSLFFYDLQILISMVSLLIAVTFFQRYLTNSIEYRGQASCTKFNVLPHFLMNFLEILY